MNLQKPSGPHDEQSFPDGDQSFTGVDERPPPPTIPSGFVGQALNTRFRFGKAETRPGVLICPWMKNDGKTPWTAVYGGAVFSDPTSGVQWFIIAADGGVWRTRPGMVAKPVALPAGVTLTAGTFSQFVQCFNVLILLRGLNTPELVCSDLDLGFQTAPQPTPGAGLVDMPPANYGVSFLNRLLLIDSRDTIAVSNVQDYTQYLPLQQEFRINQGDADALVAIAPYDRDTLIMLKEQGVFQLTGASGDLSGLNLTGLTDKYGLAAPLGWAKSGGNLYWLTGEGAVASLTLTEQNNVQDTSNYLSDPLLTTFGRVNGLYLSGVTMAVWRARMYVALPLDDATFNGPNLIPPGATSTGGTYLVPGLTLGQQYTWTPDPGGGQTLQDGPNTYSGMTPVVFTLLNSARLFGSARGSITALYTGVNNGVAVYDFLNQAWCGTDEAPGVFAVKQFLKAKFNGKIRLFFLGADGTLRLYEEGYNDEVLGSVPVPYTEVLVNSLPAVGNTITVDGQATTTAANSATNGVNAWGCDNLTDAQNNLAAGYLALQFAAGLGTTVTATNWGVRFSSASNRTVAPVVVVTGSWAFVQAHAGGTLLAQEITTQITTRGYQTAVRILSFPDIDRKRFLSLAMHLLTWHPSYTLTAVLPGYASTNNEQGPITRDATKYDLHQALDWVNTNVNNDHATRNRLDYSVQLPDAGFNLGTGVFLDAEQFSVDRVPVSEHGNWLQVQLTNTQGRISLVAAQMEAVSDERLSGAHV